MRHVAKVDTSLQERQGILELLERLKDEELTLGELEEIGSALKKAGHKGLRPLLRELGREEKGELISKYAYILDFFEEEAWLDHLVRIAQMRRDLPEDAQAALKAALKWYGLEGHLCPDDEFHHQRWEEGLAGSPEGVVRLLDDFLSYPGEIQQLILQEMPKAADARAIRLLQALLWHEEEDIVSGALTALSRIRDPLAAGALAGFLEEGDPSHRSQCQRSLRRLLFLGIVPKLSPAPLSFHQTFASVPDGDGYRALFISRWIAPKELSVLYLHLHEERGLLAAWGGDGLTEKEFRDEVEAFSSEEQLYPVEPGHAVELLADSLNLSGDLAYLPADFYLQRHIFRGCDLTPRPYRPELSAFLPARPLSYPEGESLSAELFNDPFFSGWLLADQEVFDFAADHEALQEAEAIRRFCAEIIAPKLERIRERLLLTADLMRRTSAKKRSVAQVVALAQSLSGYRLPYHLHPFLRRFAAESLEAARGALAAGGDLPFG